MPTAFAIPLRFAATLLATVALLAAVVGCQSKPVVAERPPDRGAYVDQLRMSTDLIQRGNLARARVHADNALAMSTSPREADKSRDLLHLIDGAEALAEGDTRRAVDHWSAVTDPSLRAQLDARTRSLGLNQDTTIAREGASR